MVNGKKDIRLVSLEHTVNCRTQRTASIATLAVQGLQVVLAGSKPGGEVELGLFARNWVVYHIQQSGHAAVTVWMAALQELHGYMLLQDTELQWRRGDVTLKQVVPKGEWRSIPRPEIKVQQLHTFRKRGRHDITTGLVLNYDTVQARTRLTGSIHSGPGRAYKAVVDLDSLAGKAATARVKLQHPIVHSLAATIHEDRRLVLAAKSRLFNRLKVKAALDQQEDQAMISMTYMPADGKRTVVKADVTMDSLRSVAQVVLGIKWHF